MVFDLRDMNDSVMMMAGEVLYTTQEVAANIVYRFVIALGCRTVSI